MSLERLSRSERPRLEYLSGESLPKPMRVLHELAVAGQRPVRRLARQVIWRLLAERLPTVVATYGDGRRFIAPCRDVMYAQIFMYGAYEPDASRVVADLLREGDFTVDIGANHGWYTVLMGARVGPRGQVWAVEPTPPLLAALEANVRINPTLPVAVQPIALGITGGSAELHLFRGLPHGHASGSTLGRNDYSTYRVPRRRLDDLLAEAATAAPTFVKLDVEGGELEVLRGAERLAGSDHAPIWMLEVNFETSAAFGYKPRDLISYLREAGPYSAYRVAPQGLQIEVDPDSAPHGTTWICVPPAFGDRVKAQL